MIPPASAGRAASHHGVTLALRLVARSNFSPLAARAVLRSGTRGSVAVAVRPFSATRAAFIKKPSQTPAAKKKSLAAKKVKAAKAKVKAAKKKKASAKKPTKKLKKKKKKAVVNKPKKLTREQRARARDRIKKREAIQHRKDLRAESLISEEPKPGPNRAYVVFATEKGPALRAKGLSLTEMAKQLGVEWKALSAAEQEGYKVTANSNQENYLKTYAAWVKKHSPTQIYKANMARKALKRQGVIARPSIKDDRQPAGIKNAYAAYVQEHLNQHKGGDKTIKELFSEAAVKWKALTPAEKKVCRSPKHHLYICVRTLLT